MKRRFKSTLSMVRYYYVARRLRSTLLLLEKITETAEYFEREALIRAQSALIRVPDALRAQVCTECQRNHYNCDDPQCDAIARGMSPHHSHGCEHSGVPSLDITKDIPEVTR